MNYICTVSNFEGFNGNFRIIHTGLCGKLAIEILRSIEGQLSDGYWENSPMMEKYWKNEYVLRMDNEEESEIVIVVNGKNGEGKMVPYRWSYREMRMIDRWKWIENPFYRMSDNEIKNWFAEKIKRIVKLEEADNKSKGWWTDKNSDHELDYFGYDLKIKVSDCKKVYKVLKRI